MACPKSAARKAPRSCCTPPPPPTAGSCWSRSSCRSATSGSAESPARTERRGRRGPDTLGSVVARRGRRLRNRARRVDDVVLDDAGPPFDITDDVHHFRGAILASAFVDDRELAVETLGVGAGAFGPSRVRRQQRQLRRVEPREVVDDDRRRKQVVNRNVKEPLNLRLARSIVRNPVFVPAALKMLATSLARNRHSRLVLLYLHRSRRTESPPSSARRRTAEHVNIVVRRSMTPDRPSPLHPRRLAARRTRPFHGCSRQSRSDLRVRKPPQPGLSGATCTEKPRDLARQLRDARSPRTPSARRTRSPTGHLASAAASGSRWAEGFEPSIRCEITTPYHLATPTSPAPPHR